MRAPSRKAWIAIVLAVVALNAIPAWGYGRPIYAAWRRLATPIEQTTLEAKQDAREELRPGLILNHIIALSPHGGWEDGWHGIPIVAGTTAVAMRPFLFTSCVVLGLVWMWRRGDAERLKAAAPPERTDHSA